MPISIRVDLPERFYKKMNELIDAIDENTTAIENLKEEPQLIITGISHVPRPVPLKEK